MRLIFTSDFTYQVDERTTRTIPEGWSGEVDDDVAELAMEADAVEMPEKPKPVKKKRTKAKAKSTPAPTPAPASSSSAPAS